jgi:hypothetical protein
MSDSKKFSHPTEYIQIKKLINQASKQIPKGLSSICGDSLLKETNKLLTKNPIDSDPNKDIKHIVIKLVKLEQARLVKKYLSKMKVKEGKSKDLQSPRYHHPWGKEGAAIKTACNHNNELVLQALLQGGLSPTIPTEDQQADRLLLIANEKMAKIALNHYTTRELKTLIDKGNKKEEKERYIKSPYRHFPQSWLIKLAKETLVTKKLEEQTNKKIINIEI